jgi:hypothetical protein
LSWSSCLLAAALTEFYAWHVTCLVFVTRREPSPPAVPSTVMAAGPFTQPLSVRAHFWLRMTGVVVVLAAQFGPRIVGSFSVPPAPAASGIALVGH